MKRYPDYKGRMRYIEDTVDGETSISDDDTWAVSKVKLCLIDVVTAATDWTLTLYPDDDFDNSGIAPSIVIAPNANGNQTIHVAIPYESSNQEIHLDFVDNIGAEDAVIYIAGEGM